jgi:hypothetical protein
MDATTSDTQPPLVTNGEEIKQRATVEDLLNLSVKGWEDIAKMDDSQLAIYLSDITNLEPKSDMAVGQLRGAKVEKSKALKDVEDDDDEENPIKFGANKKAKKTKQPKPSPLNISAEDLAKELGIDL